jgi:hypothetical protein
VPKLFQTLPLDVDGVPLKRNRRRGHRPHDDRGRWKPHSM